MLTFYKRCVVCHDHLIKLDVRRTCEWCRLIVHDRCHLTVSVPVGGYNHLVREWRFLCKDCANADA